MDKDLDHKPGQRIIACDFDMTLAEYDHWRGINHLGAPVPEMLEKVQDALERGDEVWIFTARVAPKSNSFEDCVAATKSILLLAEWCQKYIGELLPITHEKNPRFTEIWDDRVRQVVPNQGIFVTDLMDAAHGSHR